MSKREASQIAAAGVDIDAPRAKRRREAPAAVNGTSAREQPETGDASTAVKADGQDGDATREDREAVKEKGSKLWQTVKDAVNKEGRPLTADFMRLPSKRQYPDYYQLIKRPIALDDIKIQLDVGAYAAFEDVKGDLETCFRNAKRYNIKESQIWKDAKHLHKLVIKEYSKMTGTAEDPAADAAEDGDEHGGFAAGGSDDEGGKKKKPPNMTRLLKSRLQKVVEKTDEDGRVLSTEFMELPNRKQWAMYYKLIKRPQCLENIFKHLKRKEYHTSQDFANDVELVFANALQFNQDHSQVWEDATTLRDYFRQIMSDLPPPHTIPAYTSGAEASTSTKIKLKVPAASISHPPTQSSLNATASLPAQPTPTPAGTLRIPAQHPPAVNGTTSKLPLPEASKSPSATPAVPPAPATTAAPPAQPAKTTVTTIAVTPAAVTQIKPAPVTPTASTSTLQPANYAQVYNPYAQHYPNAIYQGQPPGPNAAVSTMPIATAPSTATPAPSATVVSTAQQVQTPATQAQSHRQLKNVTFVTKPLGRRLVLDHREGVRVWALRLSGESGVRVSGVTFSSTGEEEDESGDEEGKDREALKEEKEKFEKEQNTNEQTQGEEPKVKRGKGRPRKRPKMEEGLKELKEVQEKEAKVRMKGKAPIKAVPPPLEVVVKLNGVQVPNPVKTSEGEEWDVEVPVGASSIEVGERSGVTWRVYVDRPSAY